METPFEVTLEIEVDYALGSPPDDTVDPYEILQGPEVWRHTSVWMSREGPTEGMLLSSYSALYPPFTAATRRTVFFMLQFATPTVTWNGASFPAGNFWLTTDPSWANPVVIASAGEGHWFACEGELEADFRIWKAGKSEQITL